MMFPVKSSVTDRDMIRNLIFDLDNTVYPMTSRMCMGVGGRIAEYARRFYKLAPSEAPAIRTQALKIYGTTLEWLKAGGFTDVEDYFSFVHPASEIEELDKAPELARLLDSIDMPKIILTNAPGEHAEHVLEFLEVRDRFHETICDIRMNDFKGKPQKESYLNALRLLGGNTDDTLFLDDYPVYVEGYAALGGTSVLVGSEELSEKADSYPGKIYRIKDIYELPALIEKLNSE